MLKRLIGRYCQFISYLIAAAGDIASGCAAQLSNAGQAFFMLRVVRHSALGKHG